MTRDMIESIRKWKYATFAVLGVLALVIATPTAFAASSGGGSDISKTVLDILKNTQSLMTQSSSIASTTTATQNSLVSTQNGILAVQTQLEDIEGQVGLKALPFELRVDAADGTIKEVDILPFVQGKAYHGHIEMAIAAGGQGNKVSVRCGMGLANDVLLFEQEGAGFPAFERDFSCVQLYAQFIDLQDGNDQISSTILGIATYSETDGYSELRVDE